jgi:hypothetical protein
MTTAFPAPPPNMTLHFGAMPSAGDPMLIVGMFTASHVATAQRLLASLRRFSLPHALFEVPIVHRSISPKGTPDLTYTKANFIWHAIQMVERPVLYLDVDTVIRHKPELIFRLIAEGHDFAILNWLAQDNNDAYMPVVLDPARGSKNPQTRFFRYSHHIDLLSNDQMVCSGAVELWGPTPAAAALLAGWHETIHAQPGVPDDQCLDFAFNNRIGGWQKTLRPYWLPKPYARYAWWIFDEPIIDHPDFPYSGTGQPEINDPSGRQRLYVDRAALRRTPPRIPRDCIIDTKTGELLRIQNKSLVPFGRAPQKIWVSQ